MLSRKYPLRMPGGRTKTMSWRFDVCSCFVLTGQQRTRCSPAYFMCPKRSIENILNLDLKWPVCLGEGSTWRVSRRTLFYIAVSIASNIDSNVDSNVHSNIYNNKDNNISSNIVIIVIFQDIVIMILYNIATNIAIALFENVVHKYWAHDCTERRAASRRGTRMWFLSVLSLLSSNSSNSSPLPIPYLQLQVQISCSMTRSLAFSNKCASASSVVQLHRSLKLASYPFESPLLAGA